jgi:hypothetical protein
MCLHNARDQMVAGLDEGIAELERQEPIARRQMEEATVARKQAQRAEDEASNVWGEIAGKLIQARESRLRLLRQDDVSHVGMHAHDGLAPHSHEVRPDHRGVERMQADHDLADGTDDTARIARMREIMNRAEQGRPFD